MGVTAIKDLVLGLPRKEQIQLAIHILNDLADEKNENEWLTDEVADELLRRKEAALADTSHLRSHDEVMQSIQK